MYKKVKKYKLNGKDKDHLKSLIRNLVRDLTIHGKIVTTLAKAKVLKSEFDKVVTLAKKNTEASKRLVKSFFANNERITTRFFKIVDQYLNSRNSGYTRVLRTLPRAGDSAEMAYVCIVGMENYKSEKNKNKSEVEKLLKKKKSTEGIRNKVQKILNQQN